jgi:glucan phosphoethanolaminetransferase (alkaline phosphatase superfamily)
MGTMMRFPLNLPTAAEDKLGARHYTLAAILIAILSAYCLAYERSIFGLSATMAIIAFFALVTGRLLFPAVLAATTAAIIVSISAVKHSMLQVAFMLPDIILVANSEMFFYMWSSEVTGYMTALTLVLVASGVLLGITIWRDRTKIRPKWAALALLISLVTGYLSQAPWLFE